VKKSSNNPKQEFTENIYNQISVKPQTLERFKNVFWKNPRHKDEGGWGITEYGHTVLSELDIKCYPIDLSPDTVITNQVLIWMDRFLDGPWYWENKKTLHVYKEKTAFQLILFSGDLHKYGWSMTESKKSL
jgi:hypothetical protein